MLGDKYSFLPFTLNSVTSVTHFSLGRFASKLRFRRLSQIRPCSPLYERYFLTWIRLLIRCSVDAYRSCSACSGGCATARQASVSSTVSRRSGARRVRSQPASSKRRQQVWPVARSIAARPLWMVSPDSNNVQCRALIYAVLNFTSCQWVRCRTITDSCSSVLTAISLPSCVFSWKEITESLLGDLLP